MNHLCLHAYYSHFQEKTVALKIFELGLKKYGGIPEYLLCYMDFMSHLNGNFFLRVFKFAVQRFIPNTLSKVISRVKILVDF